MIRMSNEVFQELLKRAAREAMRRALAELDRKVRRGKK